MLGTLYAAINCILYTNTHVYQRDTTNSNQPTTVKIDIKNDNNESFSQSAFCSLNMSNSTLDKLIKIIINNASTHCSSALHNEEDDDDDAAATRWQWWLYVADAVVAAAADDDDSNGL